MRFFAKYLHFYQRSQIFDKIMQAKTPILIVGGALLTYLLYNLGKQTQTDFKILKYRLTVPDGKAGIELLTEVNNESDLPIKIQNINLNVYVNGNLVGNIQPGKIFTVPAKKRARLPLVLSLTGGGADLIKVLTNMKNLGKPIQVRGTLQAQGINMNINTNIQP